MSILKKIDDYVENIIEATVEDIFSDRFAKYSKYIIQDRALPDVRDGLKPVQRRILYAMHQLGMFHNRPYKKSARITGEVMGKYHPHGDSSIYEAMVRLSQDFKMREILIDMHGNNGSIDGDSAAAMRYTEARLSKAAEALLSDMEKRTVPFVPNFDDEELEPTVLPARFPNLLVNGAMGISAGYATRIPPHNLKEVVQATLAFLDNEKMTIDDVAQYIKGPDFPTGGIVQGNEGIRQALETGAGRVIIRAKIEIEEMSKTQDRLVVTEIPYEVNKADLVRAIDTLRLEKSIDDMLEVRDESDQEGLRIAIDLKKGADARLMINVLYKATDLQVAYNYNMVSIMSHRPVLSGVLPILKAYIDHQKDVITNRSNYELERALKRQHIVQGLIKMVSVIEGVIQTIRSSQNKQNAKENLMAQYDFSEMQAEAIVTLQLYRLSNTDILALEKEDEQLNLKIKEYQHVLSSENALKRVIKRELTETVELLGDERRTLIEDDIETIRIDEKDLVTEEKVIIGITKEGYVKRASLRSYQATAEAGLKDDDALLFEKEVNTIDTLLIFTNLGNYIYLPVYRIDEQRWKDLGVYINNITPIERGERIIDVLDIKSFKTHDVILLASKSGQMKQTKLTEFEVTRFYKPMRCMRLQNDDEMVSVHLGEQDNIIGVSKNGYVLRFLTQELPLYGLQAGGVKGMNIGEDDALARALYLSDRDDFLMLTQRGHMIKDTALELPLYSRARRGILAVPRQVTNPHEVVYAEPLTHAQQKEDTTVHVVSTKQSFKMHVSDLKYSGNKFGKKIIDEETDGKGYFFKVEPSVSEEVFIKPTPKKESIPQEKVTLKEEEIMTKDQKKIRLSRFDLFDDEDE